MRHCILTILLLLLAALAALGDGTKQLMPNCGTEAAPAAKGYCYLALGSREGASGPSRPFARYQHSSSKKSCSDENRLYFRISNTNETVYLGFGGYRNNGGSISNTPTGNAGDVLYRIKKSSTDNGYDGSDESHAGSDVIVKAEAALPSTEPNGLITSYANAYYGPKTLSFNGGTKGYTPITITGLAAGLYYIEFDIGCDYDVASGNPFDIEWFDITVATKKKNIPAVDSVINGRVYSKAWGLNANAADHEVWATFYTYSTDFYTSKVYLAGVMPFRFVFGCNSYGSIDTASTEKNRQSYPAVNSFKPEYLVFLTSPDTVSYGTAKLPNIPTGLTFSGDAITCEDLVFVIKLLYKESSTIELFLDGENGEKVLVEKLDATKVKNRGYHYPWKDNKEIKTPGYHYYVPVADGCTRRYKLSLFDHRFTIADTLMNVGDKTIGTIDPATTINWSTPLGSANNPILIRDKTDLNELSSALSDERDFHYTVDPFYVAPGNTSVSRIFNISGGSTGFQGVHFYVTAPSDSISLVGWQGIGTATNPFKGVFRCGKYNPDPASNNTNSTETQNVGDQDTIVFKNAENPLFNYCDGATIDNIHVKGTISAYEEPLSSEIPTGFGAICNYATNTTFSHCTNATSLSITKEANTISVGGIVGIATNCTIDSCSNNISISAGTPTAGGIVGTLNGGSVNFCYNVGTINAVTDAGGIIGNASGNNTVTNSRNIGSVSAQSMGGIVGYSASTALTLSDCSNSGTISSGANAGGMIGNGTPNGTISYCYNSGIILGTTRSDALANPTIFTINTNSYGTTDGSNSTISPTDLATSTGHFYSDANGQGIWATVCSGKTWRNEEAGRLFKNDSLFYITWDGKYDNGDCVTGTLTVDYQKNSGVTHFPFYDAENINLSTSLKGIVVYRISPIQDSLKSKPEYVHLPKNYYQTDSVSSTEQGIELPLYWDDRRISKSGACTEVDYGITKSNTCWGIENVSTGGDLGSTGGHIFPIKDFGDKNTMNTWWNGVEVHGLSKLILYENSPAVLMPIELDTWIVTNLRKSVFLEWSTATETNNDFFTIERSINGTTWLPIGTMDGAGTTSIAHEYSFEDAKPLNGISYYRIKQTDYNGAFSYTSIKCVNRPTDSDNAFIAYSNELLNAFIIEGEQIAACPIELYTITGIKVSNVSFNTVSSSKVIITIKDIPAGSYFIRTCNTHKVVVKNW